MGGAQILLEAVLVVLLGATLFHAMRLERALGVLKRDRAVLEGLVTGFNESTRQAEVGVERLRAATDGAGRQIAKQIEQAQRLRDDLAFLTERGDKIAERLEVAVRAARMVGDQAALINVPQIGVPIGASVGQAGGQLGGTFFGSMAAGSGSAAETEMAGAGKLRSEAERDLMRALRAAR